MTHTKSTMIRLALVAAVLLLGALAPGWVRSRGTRRRPWKPRGRSGQTRRRWSCRAPRRPSRPGSTGRRYPPPSLLSWPNSSARYLPSLWRRLASLPRPTSGHRRVDGRRTGGEPHRDRQAAAAEVARCPQTAVERHPCLRLLLAAPPADLALNGAAWPNSYVRPEDLRSFAQRDWARVERAKIAYWTRQYKEHASGPSLRAADGLRAHVHRFAQAALRAQRALDLEDLLRLKRRIDAANAGLCR